MKAQAILQCAASVMEERAKQYDKPEGERSIPAVVDAFNAIKGGDRMMSHADGWLFMVLLKLVRSQTAKGKALFDCAEDAAAYTALMGEETLAAAEPLAIGPAFPFDADSEVSVPMGIVPWGVIRAGDLQHKADQEKKNQLARQAMDKVAQQPAVTGAHGECALKVPMGNVGAPDGAMPGTRIAEKAVTCAFYDRPCPRGAKCACDADGLK